MRLPNLIASTRGRLAAFFLLYVTEGIPLGFAATAVATQLRRQGVGPAEIGAFVGSFYLPWAFKWMFGPVIDVFWSQRLGRRRGWIMGTQVIMAATLLSLVMLDLPAQLGLFTIVLLVHNTFAAMQDVAIDSLAVNTLHENERGTANGMMFAGANIGQMIGGSGALFLATYAGFQSTYFFVAACILAVTALVVLPLKEVVSERVHAAGSRMAQAVEEMREFSVTAFRSFLGTRGAFVGVFLSLLPPGAMCMGLALQSNLAVELGLSDEKVATLNLLSTICGAVGCVVGGLIADRVDRRRALQVYILLMTLPVLVMMWVLHQQGWIMPVAPDAANRMVPSDYLIQMFWATSLAYGLFNGLMYSASTAVYMDVTNPAVAGTQFTAYMAMFNLTISYSATWQGISIEALGYPKTMLIDALYGLIFVALLPLTRRRPTDPAGYSDHRATGRARKLALGLAVMNLAWLPLHFDQGGMGAAVPILQTVYSLVFIMSAVFLAAGSLVLKPANATLARLGMWMAPLLVLMITRTHLDSIASGLGLDPALVQRVCEPYYYLVPLAAAALLVVFSRETWQPLAKIEDEAEAEDAATQAALAS